MLWLDLTNAYGSIPHKQVEVALEKHHVPKKVKDLILYYYSKFSLRVSFGQVTSDWHQLEVGIITGYTISVFMDDLTVTTTAVPGARWILQGLESIMAWACMNLQSPGPWF